MDEGQPHPHHPLCLVSTPYMDPPYKNSADFFDPHEIIVIFDEKKFPIGLVELPL